MANIIEKLILNGVEYEIPSGSGGGIDAEAAAAISDAKMGNYDAVFMLKSWLYQILNWLSSEDAIGLTAGENREEITNNTDSMSIISHGWTVMSWIANSKYAMELICSKDGATKEVSECWNSIYIIANSELARGIYLNSEYWPTYLANYEVVQNAFDKVYNSLLGKDLIGFLCVQSYYTKIMNNTEKKNSLKVLSLNDFMPVFKAYTDIADYATFAELENNTTDLNKVLNNSNCTNVMQLATDFMEFAKKHITSFVNNSSVMQAIAKDSTAMAQIVNDATTMNAIAGSSTAMGAMASSAIALNKITKSSTAIAAITSSANNSRLQAVRTTMYNTVVWNSTYFTQITRTYQDSVSSLNNSTKTANCIVFFAGGYWSSTSQYSNMFHPNGVQAVSANNYYRPTSVSSSQLSGTSFTNCTFTETGDGYAAIAVYQAK